MSIARCDDCDCFVDSDEDPECYEHTPDKCFCENCRQNRDIQTEDRNRKKRE